MFGNEKYSYQDIYSYEKIKEQCYDFFETKVKSILIILLGGKSTVFATCFKCNYIFQSRELVYTFVEFHRYMNLSDAYKTYLGSLFIQYLFYIIPSNFNNILRDEIYYYFANRMIDETQTYNLTKTIFIIFNDIINEDLQSLRVLYCDLLQSNFLLCLDKFILKQTEEKKGVFNLNVQEFLNLITLKTINIFGDYFYNSNNSSRKFTDALYLALLNQLWLLRISELFEIMIEYPESKPALENLRKCLDLLELYNSTIIYSLINKYNQRLLHAGTSTTDIITVYITSFSALEIFNDSRNLQVKVSSPILNYLRFRNDAVKCIISNITENKGFEFLHNFCKLSSSNDNEINAERIEKWQPLLLSIYTELENNYTQYTLNKDTDIFSILINVYGSKMKFLSEYRILMADRLLSSLDYNVEKEKFYIDVLRSKLGDCSLHFCEIMLQDFVESQSINETIQRLLYEQFLFTDNQPEYKINCFILSKVFWPSIKDEELSLPLTYYTAFYLYNKCFEGIKSKRYLELSNTLGLVDIEIEMGIETYSFSLPPIIALIISLFEEKRRWSLQELKFKLNTTISFLTKKINYWVKNGFLVEIEKETFELIIREEFTHQIQTIEYLDEQSLCIEKRRSAVIESCWHYIKGTLSYSNLSLESIISLVISYLSQGFMMTNNITIKDIEILLESKLKDEKLTFSKGKYSIVVSD